MYPSNYMTSYTALCQDMCNMLASVACHYAIHVSSSPPVQALLKAAPLFQDHDRLLLGVWCTLTQRPAESCSIKVIMYLCGATLWLSNAALHTERCFEYRVDRRVVDR